MNTLATKLGLLDDDIKQEEKLFRLCADLRSKILTPVDGEFSWRYSEADLSADDALKADFRSWPAFTDKTVWSKKQGHTWFAAEVTVPEAANQVWPWCLAQTVVGVKVGHCRQSAASAAAVSMSSGW